MRSSPSPRPSSNFADAADRQAARRAIQGGSKSFYAASLLLPRWMRDPSYALYAFCRQSDDIVDVAGGAKESIALLLQRLDSAYRGMPCDDPIDRLFADTVREFAIPRALPEALIEGLAWDVEGRVYETLDDVYAYAARVAGSVGAMMSVLMGARAEATVARACELGLAMQLTNIARDVGEDARNGRLYLPRVWLREAGIDPEDFLAAPAMTPALGRVIARLLDAADALYANAEPGIADLPRSCRPAIRAAGRLYRAIGQAVAGNGYDSVSVRAHVTSLRKLQLIANAHLPAGATAIAPPAGIAQTRFLVDAVALAPVPQRTPKSFADRIVWAAELLATLDQRQRARA